MNRKQLICLWLGIVVVLALVLYPPWYLPERRPIPGVPDFIEPASTGYTWIFNLPSGSSVDLSRFGIQVGIVLLPTAALILTFRTKRS